MRVLFYGLLILLFFVTVLFGDRKVRKDQYCKEGLFFQMFLNKCTPRDFLLDKKKVKVYNSYLHLDFTNITFSTFSNP